LIILRLLFYSVLVLINIFKFEFDKVFFNLKRKGQEVELNQDEFTKEE